MSTDVPGVALQAGMDGACDVTCGPGGTAGHLIVPRLLTGIIPAVLRFWLARERMEDADG